MTSYQSIMDYSNNSVKFIPLSLNRETIFLWRWQKYILLRKNNLNNAEVPDLCISNESKDLDLNAEQRIAILAFKFLSLNFKSLHGHMLQGLETTMLFSQETRFS